MDKKRVLSEFISTSFGLPWHGWLIRDTYFVSTLELKVNESQKRSMGEMLKNRIKIF